MQVGLCFRYILRKINILCYLSKQLMRCARAHRINCFDNFLLFTIKTYPEIPAIFLQGIGQAVDQGVRHHPAKLFLVNQVSIL